MSCEQWSHKLEVFLDGELSPEEMLHVQEHAEGCNDCRQELAVSMAIRRTTRELVVAEGELSPGFEQDLARALSEEERAERRGSGAPVGGVRRLLHHASLAAAAAFGIWLGSRTWLPLGEPTRELGEQSATTMDPSAVAGSLGTFSPGAGSPIAGPASPDIAGGEPGVADSRRARSLRRNASAGVGVFPAAAAEDDPFESDKPFAETNPFEEEKLADSLVVRHVTAQPPELRDRSQVWGWSRQLGVRVDPPDRVRGANWAGASLFRVRHQPAAQLSYRYPGGRRVSAYIYDPQRVPLHAELTPQRISGTNQHVYLGSYRGYPVAAFVYHGVGYAVTGDLKSDRESTELVRMIAVGHSASP